MNSADDLSPQVIDHFVTADRRWEALRSAAAEVSHFEGVAELLEIGASLGTNPWRQAWMVTCSFEERRAEANNSDSDEADPLTTYVLRHPEPDGTVFVVATKTVVLGAFGLLAGETTIFEFLADLPFELLTRAFDMTFGLAPQHLMQPDLAPDFAYNNSDGLAGQGAAVRAAAAKLVNLDSTVGEATSFVRTMTGLDTVVLDWEDSVFEVATTPNEELFAAATCDCAGCTDRPSWLWVHDGRNRSTTGTLLSLVPEGGSVIVTVAMSNAELKTMLQDDDDDDDDDAWVDELDTRI